MRLSCYITISDIYCKVNLMFLANKWTWSLHTWHVTMAWMVFPGKLDKMKYHGFIIIWSTLSTVWPSMVQWKILPSNYWLHKEEPLHTCVKTCKWGYKKIQTNFEKGADLGKGNQVTNGSHYKSSSEVIYLKFRTQFTTHMVL